MRDVGVRVGYDMRLWEGMVDDTQGDHNARVSGECVTNERKKSCIQREPVLQKERKSVTTKRKGARD
jgi:hypothetical protein